MYVINNMPVYAQKQYISFEGPRNRVIAALTAPAVVVTVTLATWNVPD